MLSNYYGITISYVVYKMLVGRIEHQVIGYIEEYGILSDYQCAFLRARRCKDHMYCCLKGKCSLKKSRKQKTYLAFLDISKAFDTVDRTALFIDIFME